MDDEQDEFITDGEALTKSEGQFCGFVQSENALVHPERTYSFDAIHVSDVLGCLYKAALSRLYTQTRSCFSTIAMADGIMWEGYDQECPNCKRRVTFGMMKKYLLLYGYKADGFDRQGYIPLKVSSLPPVESLPPDAPSARKVQVIPGPSRLIGSPDYYDGSTLCEIKRTRYSLGYVQMICANKEAAWKKLKTVFDADLHYSPSHIALDDCRFWPNYIHQLCVYHRMFPSKKSELRVVYNDGPRFWNVTKLVNGLADPVMDVFLRRAAVLAKYLPDQSKHKLLYEYECITRWDETFCRDCPFLGQPCLGIAPLKQKYLRKREVSLIMGLGAYYHRNLPPDIAEEIKNLRMPGDMNKAGDKELKASYQSEKLMLALPVLQAQYSMNRLKFAGLTVEQMEGGV